jgi:uncharacterized protein YaaR (DUF327 family)
MGISRRQALKRIDALADQVEQHLEKLGREPQPLAANHWKSEVREFLRQIRRLVPKIGHRTGQLWIQRLENWDHEMEKLG